MNTAGRCGGRAGHEHREGAGGQGHGMNTGRGMWGAWHEHRRELCG